MADGDGKRKRPQDLPERVLRIAKALYENYGADRVILFGSVARGEAREELDMARVALEKDYLKQAAVHVHQALEKVLKGFIIRNGKKPPRVPRESGLSAVVQETGRAAGLQRRR